MNKSMMGVLKSLWDHISYKRRRQAALLLILAIFTSFAEIISLGAVLPFIGVLTQPDKIMAYPFVTEITQFFEVESDREFAVVTTLQQLATTPLHPAPRSRGDGG